MTSPTLELEHGYIRKGYLKNVKFGKVSLFNKYKFSTFNLNSKKAIYKFLAQAPVLDFSFYCLYFPIVDSSVTTSETDFYNKKPQSFSG